jgi:hypothetical protein
MEVERERYAQSLTVDSRGHAVLGPDQKVGQTEKFEFGVPGDAVSLVVGGGFTNNFHPDFLQREMGKDGMCARFYFDRKIVLDIADPESETSKKKRKLLFKHGFGYLCIPSGFSKDEKKLRVLYEAALQEYYDYEKRHPRPAAVQEAIVIDNKGAARRALMTAIDIRVGGGIIGNVEQQAAELRESSKLSKSEAKQVKLRTKLFKRLRRSVQSGTPFRNPFVGKGERLYNVEYHS